MEKSNQELSAPDQLETLIQEKFSFTRDKKSGENSRKSCSHFRWKENIQKKKY